MTDHDPTPAMGADTLIGVLRRADEQGFTTPFRARDDGDIDCGNCERAVNPAAVDVEHVHRLEGASDAADLMLVTLGTCPSCSAKGVLTLGYGPNASSADEAVLLHLPIRPGAARPLEG